MLKPIFRTVFVYEVISDEPILDSVSLETIANETTNGSWSGRFLDNSVHNEELTGKAAVEAITAQGSDPEFFMLDNEGNEIE